MIALIVIAILSILVNAFLNITRFFDECSGHVNSEYKSNFLRMQLIVSSIGLSSIMLWIVNSN